MEALRDKIKDSKALEIASRPAKMVFLAYRGFKTRAIGLNHFVYRDLALRNSYS